MAHFKDLAYIYRMMLTACCILISNRFCDCLKFFSFQSKNGILAYFRFADFLVPVATSNF